MWAALLFIFGTSPTWKLSDIFTFVCFLLSRFPVNNFIVFSPNMQFDVTNLNYVSQADDVPLVPTVILFVAFSENGDWMSTVSKSPYCSFSALSESFTYCSSCGQWGTIRVHSV